MLHVKVAEQRESSYLIKRKFTLFRQFWYHHSNNGYEIHGIFLQDALCFSKWGEFLKLCCFLIEMFFNQNVKMFHFGTTFLCCVSSVATAESTGSII